MDRAWKRCVHAVAGIFTIYDCLEFVWMFLIALKVRFNGSFKFGIVISLFSCQFF